MFKAFGGISFAAIILVGGCISDIHVHAEDRSNQKLCHRPGAVYVHETGKCYLEGSQGPCPQLMTVQRLDNNHLLGDCKCQTFDACGSDTRSRPLVYWEETDRCYFLFGRGPCKKREWLVSDEEGYPYCETIPCPHDYKDQDLKISSKTKEQILEFVFPYENECYTTQTQGFCSPGMVTYFGKGSFTPKCREAGMKFSPGYTINSKATLACASGEMDGFGGCESNANF